jgi:phosphoribosylformylglycinamidine synthase
MLSTVVLPGADAAVLRIKDFEGNEADGRGIAITTDCNGRYCYLDPYVGAQIAFAEAARNLACVGARPAAITDCLNFGSPEKPKVFWTFHEAVRGLADACRAFGTPVISGNVSFYNESFGKAIYPTPTVGMVGIVEDVGKSVGPGFVVEGDVVVLLGETTAELGGSEYLKVAHGQVAGTPPSVDLESEGCLHELVVDAIERGLVRSAHDCSEGGLAVALAECCIQGGIGADVHLPGGANGDLGHAVELFSESQGRILASTRPEDVDALMDTAIAAGVPMAVIGTVFGGSLDIEGVSPVLVGELEAVWGGALEAAVSGG